MRTKVQPLTFSDSLKCTAQHSTKIPRNMHILICAPESECAVCVCIYTFIYLDRYRYMYIYVNQVQPRNKIGRDSSDLRFRGQLVKSNRTEHCLHFS